MAGIAGIRASGADLEGMLQTLRHRGPHETWLSPGQYLRFGCCLLPPEMMPEHIVCRIKRPFAAGAGSSAIMGPLAEKLVSGSDFMGHRQTEEGLRVYSAEELY